METFSALLAICAGNSPVPGDFPAQRPVTRSFDVFFDLGLNKRFSKQSWGWWFETSSCPLWRQCNVHGVKACNGTCQNFAVAVKSRDHLRKLDLYFMKSSVLRIDILHWNIIFGTRHLYIKAILLSLHSCAGIRWTLYEYLYRHFIKAYFQVSNLDNCIWYFGVPQWHCVILH